jgi:hypothetical protein
MLLSDGAHLFVNLLLIIGSEMNLNGTGIPTRTELVTMYSQYNTLCSPEVLLQWKGLYMAFLFFKNCVIVQGVAQREKDGVAASAMAKKGRVE